MEDRFSALVADTTGFVVGVAAEFRGRGVPLEDLVAEGHVGLVEAARRFDARRGTKFITYAGWWIRKRILQALSEQPRAVRVSSYRRKLDRAGGRTHVAVRLRVVGLDDRPAGGSASVAERLASREGSAEENLLRDEEARIVRQALATLTLPERRVITLRFGFEGDAALTLQEAGARLGVSRERVRQIEVRALGRLRRAVASRHARRARGAA